jgi:hypothetical protein
MKISVVSRVYVAGHRGPAPYAAAECPVKEEEEEEEEPPAWEGPAAQNQSFPKQNSIKKRCVYSRSLWSEQWRGVSRNRRRVARSRERVSFVAIVRLFWQVGDSKGIFLATESGGASGVECLGAAIVGLFCHNRRSLSCQIWSASSSLSE